MAVIAKVAVQAATYAIDKAYDYLLPEEVGGQAGCRVLVPFGRGNRLTEAMILSLHQAVPEHVRRLVSHARAPEGVPADSGSSNALQDQCSVNPHAYF